MLTSIPVCASARARTRLMGRVRTQSDIGALRNLKLLNLSANRLESIPAAVGLLTNLVKLDMSSNVVSEIPAGVPRPRAHGARRTNSSWRLQGSAALSRS